MKLKFRVLNTTLKGQEVETTRDLVRVGRAPDNDLVLQEHSVSRYHAVLVCRDGKLLVEDAGSRNQTQVDGQAVFSSKPLKSGSILTFGDVLVEVTLPDGAPSAQEDAAEKTPLAGMPVLREERAQESPGAAPAADAAPAATAPRSGPPPVPAWLVPAGEAKIEKPVASKALERQLWPVLTLILGVAAAIVMVLFFLNRSGAMDVPAGEYGVCLRVGEDKVVEVPRGFVQLVEMNPAGTVKFSRPLNIDIAAALSGLSQGMTTVKLADSAGRYIYLHVRVLPRLKEEVDDFMTGGVAEGADRTELARQRMRRGEVLREQGELYAAWREYGRALSLLDPLKQNPPQEYMKAEAWAEKLTDEIQQRYEELTTRMRDFMKDGDRRSALQCLAEIKQLIPDERDVRWQNADLVYRLLEKAINAERERTRRGL